MTTDGRTPLLAGSLTSLRALGYDERWLQDWLAQAPGTLGLGEIKIIDQEQGQSGGGSLDLLAVDAETDTYYSIEVQLGEIDASHSFRVFDYWARNRTRYPGQTHVAVLVAENATGRYRPALEALAETVPLIVIELRTLKGAQEAVLVPEVVIANESLDLTGTATGTIGQERTEAEWRDLLTDEAWAFNAAFVDWARANLGDVRVNYAGKSYVGVRVGRRTWAPLWPRQDGAMVYLPDPDGTRSDEPSVAFAQFETRLAAEGLSANWQPTYNAKANPVVVRLRRQDLERPVVQDLLRASYDILAEGAQPWSERTAGATVAAPAESAAAVPAPPADGGGTALS